MSSLKKLNIPILVVVIVLILLAAIGGYIGYYYYNQYNILKTNPQAVSARETHQIISRVSQLMQLPTNESPQIATVVNPTLVQSHTPFLQAETGDMILIYTRMKRAILYRPSVNKIIDVAPVIIGAPTQTPTHTLPPTLTPTPSVKAKLHISNTIQ